MPPRNMANTTPVSAKPTHSRLVRATAFVLLALIVLTALIFLIIWLSVKPKQLIYTIEDSSIHGLSLSNNNHLNATFDFVLRAYNPNTKVSIYYDRVEASVSYNDQKLGFSAIEPLFQGHRNVTYLRSNVVARDVMLFGDVAKDLKGDKGSGEVELEIEVEAKIRFKVGIWKSGHKTLRITCSPVLVHLQSPYGFERTFCDLR